MRECVEVRLSRGNQGRLFEIEGVSQKKPKVSGRQVFLQTVKSYQVSSTVKLWLIKNDSNHIDIFNRMARIFHLPKFKKVRQTSDILLARKRDMSSFKKILIAVDGSSHSLDAVRYVALNFSSTDLRVNLLYVMDTAAETFGDLEKAEFFERKMRAKHTVWEKTEKKAAQDFLDEARSLLLRANFREDDVRVIIQERQVGIARDIIAESSRGYDAVVVGRRGLSKLEDIFLGSVSYKIVHGVENTPVWVVGGDIRSKKMLLAVDDSDNSRKAVDYASTFAVANGAEVKLFNVVREFRLDFLDISTPRGAEIEMRIVKELERDIQQMFAAYRKQLEWAGVEAVRISSKYTLQSGTRAGDILKEAREENYGTIVMGRRGLSKVHEFFLGRVTTKVLHRAADFALWIVP